MNTGTMNLGYDDEDFNEIDLRANANKEMGTETYEFLYGAGANATRRLTGTQPLNTTNTLSSAQETPSMTIEETSLIRIPRNFKRHLMLRIQMQRANTMVSHRVNPLYVWQKRFVSNSTVKTLANDADELSS